MGSRVIFGFALVMPYTNDFTAPHGNRPDWNIGMERRFFSFSEGVPHPAFIVCRKRHD